jgi:hypothetical protein
LNRWPWARASSFSDMIKRALVFIMVAVAALGAVPNGQDRRVLDDRGRLLDAELALARTQKAYFFVDLAAERIELRIRGIVLKKWDIVSYGQWGRPLPSGSFKLLQKESLRTPARANITPDPVREKDNAPQGTDLKIMELGDMPGRFRFEFENGISIGFKAPARKIPARLGGLFQSIGRSLYLPLKTIWSIVRGIDFTDVQIGLKSQENAQSIYWTAQEGMSVLVLRK